MYVIMHCMGSAHIYLNGADAAWLALLLLTPFACTLVLLPELLAYFAILSKCFSVISYAQCSRDWRTMGDTELSFQALPELRHCHAHHTQRDEGLETKSEVSSIGNVQQQQLHLDC